MSNYRRHRPVSDWLAWLGGADERVLARVPSARDRFVQMALVLLTTASLAVLSMTFALADAVKVHLAAAILCGLLWGFIILNLDRFLVLSMGSTRDRRQLLLMAAPRFAMAFVLAVVISTPLVLQVFHNDIDAELTRYKGEQSELQGQQRERSAQQKELNGVNRQIADHESVLAGNLREEVTSPALDAANEKVKGLEQDAADARRARDRTYEALQCELYGSRCRGASRRRGRGPLANAKQRQYNEAAAKFAAAQRDLDAAIRERDVERQNVENTEGSTLTEQQEEANAALPDLRARRAQLEEDLRKVADDGASTNAKDEGLLAQLRALVRAGERDGALHVAHLFVFLLFFLIEILPVSVKILLNLGPPTAYDMEAAFNEELLKDRAQIRRVEARRVEEGKSEKRVELEADMRDRETKIGKDANDHVAGEMKAIVELALHDWSELVRDELESRKQAHANGGGPIAVHGAANGNGNGKSTNGSRWRFRRHHGDDDDPYRMPSVDDL
ncbi:MAG: DUF4407 domain-containing protein [Actinomycetota bacterium]|nr:DUF4407 domain-containing protein [Actinomycetota bacterium]